MNFKKFESGRSMVENAIQMARVISSLLTFFITNPLFNTNKEPEKGSLLSNKKNLNC